MLHRSSHIVALEQAFASHPAAAILGPRQCGKTTLALQFAEKKKTVTVFDLERDSDREKLNAPEQALQNLSGLVIIDEIQRKPELFTTLRVLIDRKDSGARFLLLGSASPDIIRGISESLAGRVGMVELGGFDLSETGAETQTPLWVRGGFPRSFLAESDNASVLWRANFVRTFLERDIAQFGIRVPAETLRRFWTMIAHYHGQKWNGAEFARALGSSQPTARSYLDILAGAFMVRILPPWFENLKKRQLKSPKIYVRDSGMLHSLLGLETHNQLLGHPKLGASWEGFAIEQILSQNDSRPVYSWGTQAGAELDLLVQRGGKNFGFEFKHSDAPKTTKSMRVAIQDLSLAHLWIVYPGNDRYIIDDDITALPLGQIPSLMNTLGTFTKTSHPKS